MSEKSTLMKHQEFSSWCKMCWDQVSDWMSILKGTWKSALSSRIREQQELRLNMRSNYLFLNSCMRIRQSWVFCFLNIITFEESSLKSWLTWRSWQCVLHESWSLWNNQPDLMTVKISMMICLSEASDCHCCISYFCSAVQNLMNSWIMSISLSWIKQQMFMIKLRHQPILTIQQLFKYSATMTYWYHSINKKFEVFSQHNLTNLW